MSRPEIVMYARQRYCADVKRSRDRLTELELPWTEFDIEADSDAVSRLVELTGRRNVPTIMIGDDVMVEPSNEELDASLRRAGYHV